MDLARHEPERTCIVTRAALPAAELIRFVLGPDDRVFADLKHKLPGRGVWVTARRDLVQEAVKRRLFARAFKAEVKVGATLADDIAASLRDGSPTGPVARQQGRRRHHGICQAQLRHRRKARHCPYSCHGGGRRWAKKTGKPVAQTPRRRPYLAFR